LLLLLRIRRKLDDHGVDSVENMVVKKWMMKKMSRRNMGGGEIDTLTFRKMQISHEKIS
jgi:hypothetical protein